jgi:hypothetical protein
MKATAGPWGVSFNGKCTWTIEEVGGNHQYIARCERQQDARLIASSPELLEALMMAVRYLEHPDVLAVTNLMALPGQVVIDRIRAAIAKAE